MASVSGCNLRQAVHCMCVCVTLTQRQLAISDTPPLTRRHLAEASSLVKKVAENCDLRLRKFRLYNYESSLSKLWCLFVGKKTVTRFSSEH